MTPPTLVTCTVCLGRMTRWEPQCCYCGSGRLTVWRLDGKQIHAAPSPEYAAAFAAVRDGVR
jgi:hypothetical protein